VGFLFLDKLDRLERAFVDNPEKKEKILAKVLENSYPPNYLGLPLRGWRK
jgi:hypothetical protein